MHVFFEAGTKVYFLILNYVGFNLNEQRMN